MEYIKFEDIGDNFMNNAKFFVVSLLLLIVFGKKKS